MAVPPRSTVNLNISRWNRLHTDPNHSYGLTYIRRVSSSDHYGENWPGSETIEAKQRLAADIQRPEVMKCVAVIGINSYAKPCMREVRVHDQFTMS